MNNDTLVLIASKLFTRQLDHGVESLRAAEIAAEQLVVLLEALEEVGVDPRDDEDDDAETT